MPQANDSLVQLSGCLDEPGKPEVIYGQVLQAALAAFGADVCTIFPLNPVTGEFAAAPQVVGDLLDTKLSSVAPPRPRGLTRKILESKQVFVASLVSEPEWKSPFSEAERLVAFAAVALQAQERLKPLAVLYLDYRGPQSFDAGYQQRLRSFCEQASALLQTSWLLSRYRRVIDLGQEINQDLDTYDNLFTKLERHTRELLDTSHCFMLGVYFTQTGSLERYLILDGERRQETLRPPPPGCRTLIEESGPTLIAGASGGGAASTFIAELRGELPGVESLIAAPLRLREQPLGFLAVAHSRPGAYDQEDLHTLQLLANNVAAALNNIRLFTGLDQISKIGQLLTEKLEAEGENFLQMVADRIRETTLADLVALYPYRAAEGRFELPPLIAGKSLQPEFQQPMACDPESIPFLVAALDEPLFLEDAAELPAKLGRAHEQLGSFQQREAIVSLFATPLRVGGEKVGALFANFRSRQLFRGPQPRLHQGLSIFAAIAIKNAWQFGRRGKELTALGNIDIKLKSSLKDSLTLETVLETILIEAQTILNAEHSAILLPEAGKLPLRYAANFGGPPSVEGYGITAWVFKHRQTAHVGDVTTDPKFSDLYFDSFTGTRSELDAPLLGEKDQAVGVISFESMRPNAFDTEQRQFVEKLAGQVVMAIQMAQAYETAQRRAQERETLFEISRHIASEVELDNLLEFILAKALDTTGAMAGVLLLYDAHSNDLVIRAEKGLINYGVGFRIDLDHGIVGQVARDRQQRNIDPSDPEWRDVYLPCSFEARSLLAVPLLAGERLLGVLDVESPAENHFRPRAERMMAALADMTVVALQNAERYDAAEEGRQRLEALWDAGNQLAKLSEGSQRGEACQIVARVASERRKCRVAIRILDPQKGEMVLVAVQGAAPQDRPFERMKQTDGIIGVAYRTRKTQLIADIDRLPADMPQPMLTDPLKKTLLVAPIFAGSEVHGSLSLSHHQAHYFHDAADRTLAEGLARLLTVTFERLDGIQRQHDLQERALQAELISYIGDASFSLAHHLNNDLGLVCTYVNRVEDALEERTFSDAKVNEGLALVKESVRQVLDLGEKLKREVANFRLEDPAIVAMPAVFEELVEIFRDGSPAQRLVFDVASACGPALAVRRQVVDILRNLVTNAFEAIPELGTVTVRGRNLGPTVRIEVEDSGPGIPNADLAKVFKFLYSTKGSSGFGLWSALRKAQANAGTLEVQSPPGRGALFILTLPLAKPTVEVEFGSLH